MSKINKKSEKKYKEKLKTIGLHIKQTFSEKYKSKFSFFFCMYIFFFIFFFFFLDTKNLKHNSVRSQWKVNEHLQYNSLDVTAYDIAIHII